jgi:autotransporter-associated beta strand protein
MRARITNTGGDAEDAAGGAVAFRGNSTAEEAMFTNEGGAVRGASGGFTVFDDSSTASDAIFTNDAGAVSDAIGGFTNFTNTSTAGDATFTNDGAAVRGATGGLTEFDDSSIAANAALINNGGTGSDAVGGETAFFGASRAGNSIITNNGGAASGAFGGFTKFASTSTADSTTLIANGSTSGGLGGTVLFEGDSNGGTSRIEVFGNGSLDISAHNAPSVTIGSIEGDGNIFLGANNLLVGNNNMDTTFSGVIQDGGVLGGTGGSLTKIRTGALALSGANTYTGDTNINGGVLKVNGSITSNTFVNSIGTLAGTGTIQGDVVITGGNGTVSPGDPLGTLTVTGNYIQQASGTLLINIAGESAGEFSLLDILGNADLNGTLRPVLLADFIPAIGESFVFLDYASLSGAFSNIGNAVFNNGTERWLITYQDTNAILTATRNVPDHAPTLLLLTLSLLGLVTYQQLLRRKHCLSIVQSFLHGTLP